MKYFYGVHKNILSTGSAEYKKSQAALGIIYKGFIFEKRIVPDVFFKHLHFTKAGT